VSLRNSAGSIGNRAARILHQFDAGDAAGHRQTVGFGHLGRREHFDHLLKEYRRVPLRTIQPNLLRRKRSFAAG